MDKKLVKLTKAFKQIQKTAAKQAASPPPSTVSKAAKIVKLQKITESREELMKKIIVDHKLKNCIFNLDKIKELTFDIIQHTSHPGYSVAILICGNKYITRLNEKDRRKQGPTDILSYPVYSPDLEHNFSLMDKPLPDNVAKLLMDEHKVLMDEEKYLGEMIISQHLVVLLTD